MDELTPRVQFLQLLLGCGERADFEAVKVLPGAGVQRVVSYVSGGDLSDTREFFDNLSSGQQISLLKAVAVFEDTVGGRHSVTLLEALLPLRCLLPGDPRRDAYAWILQNTVSYSYYAPGMKSLANFDRWQLEKFCLAQANERKDAIRKVLDRERIAVKATGNLFNAVRRGDVKAVVALLALGANPDNLSPDGQKLSQFARNMGRLNISTILESKERVGLR